MQPERSVLKLATEEGKNVDKHLSLLGDGYQLTTMLESLYDSLPKHCHLPLDVEANDAGHAAGINAHLMFMCRRELTLGILILLRGYRIDSLSHLRKAIELCAFAAKMARKPELSGVWIKAGESEEAWDEFRKKFVKLFPGNDPELVFLQKTFDEASRAMHSSIYSVAHYLLHDRRGEAVPTSNVFDIRTDAVLISHFIRTIDCHLTILNVFQRILKAYTVDVTVWAQELATAKEAFNLKYHEWLPLVKTGVGQLPKKS